MADLQTICVDDTCMNNPICCNNGHFTGVDNTNINVGDTFDPRLGVTAYDGGGNSIPFVAYPSTIDTTQEGTYNIAYIAEGIDIVVRTITVVPTVAYAYIDSSTKEMHFFRDVEGKYTDQQVIGKRKYYTGFEDSTSHSWTTSDIGTVTKIIFDDVISPVSTQGWFRRGVNVGQVLNSNNLDTSKVTNMGSMFMYCNALTTLDASSWNISNVTNMYAVFYSCTSLATLNVSKWDTSSVTDMVATFYECSSLTTLDLSKWDTSKVTDMNGLFGYCTSLSTLDLNGWDTGNVTNMQDLFVSCSSLTTLDVSKWDTSSVTRMNNMFYDCTSLTTIYASALFGTTKVSNSSAMFYNCTNLVGGAGTTYSLSYIDKTRAKIDGGTSNPGYFTAKS